MYYLKEMLKSYFFNVMRKLIFLIPLLFLACSGDDENNACECRGEFQMVSYAGTAETFFAEGVECETGEPVLSHQHNMHNPVRYLGCDD